MKQLDKITRRDFTVHYVLAILSTVPVALSACGDNGNSSSPAAPTPQPTSSGGDVRGAVGTNHGHVAVITGAMLTAGNGVTLDIMGTADHSHVVDLSSDEIGQIAAGTRVQKISSNEVAHEHTVTFN